MYLAQLYFVGRQMDNPKFFKVEDDTAILFGANGTALTASLVAVAGMISETKFSIPMYPIWIYFMGLVFGFCSKAVIMIYNGDIREREKGQAARDYLISIQAQPEIYEQFEDDCHALWEATELKRKSLLTVKTAERLNYWRAAFFFASAICFIVATSGIILFISKQVAPV